MNRILVVDDETDVEFLFRQHFRKEIREKTIEFHFAFSANQALDFMATLNPFDIVVLLSDINMPGMNGLDLLKTVKQRYPYLKVMMISAYGNAEYIGSAETLGADGFITKPVDFLLLKQRLLEII